MRLAILSDIHGNLHALNRCLDDLASRGGADVIVVAGDLCMDGPKPRQVLERLQEIGARCVRGNTDRMIGLADLAQLDPEDACSVAWAREQLGDALTAWLAALPPSLAFGEDPNGLFVCHANPRNDDEHVWPDADDATLERMFGGLTQHTAAFGHLHLPFVRAWRDVVLVNVSSAGLPKDGDPRAHYTILTQRPGGWEIQSRQVDFDVEKVARQLRRSGIPDLDGRLTTLRRHRYPKLGKSGAVIP